MPVLTGSLLIQKHRAYLSGLKSVFFVGDEAAVLKASKETAQQTQGLEVICVRLPEQLLIPAHCSPNNTIIFYCYSNKTAQSELRRLLTPAKDNGYIVTSLYGHTLFSGPMKRGLIHYEAMFAQAAELALAGDYLEFGCFEGLTFSCAWNAFSLRYPAMKFFAFDGFRGISGSTSGEIFKDGSWYANRQTFEHNMKTIGVDGRRMVIVEGDYRETLAEPAAMNHYGATIASCVHIDCDVYVAAIKALRFVGPLLRQGSLVLFDEFNVNNFSNKHGERRALAEFLGENPHIQFERWLDYALGARSFIVHVD
jgi:hypothetical protein